MKRVALVVAFVCALAVPSLAHAAPTIARPDPVTYPLKLDYQDPLTGPNGKATLLAPLGQGVIMAATRDEAYLAFERRDDLGGFVPAPIGRLTLTTGGHDVLSPGTHASQIPLFQQAADGQVKSFTFTGNPSGPTPPPDNGNGPGPPPPPPTPGNTVPPPNEGFGGLPGGGSHGGGTTTTTTRRPPPTTTTRRGPPPTTTTTSTATTGTGTTAGGTTTGGGSSGSGGSSCTGGSCAAGSCGVPGIEIDSAPPGCLITISNAAPGDSASEIMTITNTTGAPYTLSLQATGSQAGALWQNGPNGLLMGVWDTSGPPPPSFPTLFYWTTQLWPLTTLNAGQSVQYKIELFLPATVGNADQGQSAVIGFRWHAQG